MISTSEEAIAYWKSQAEEWRTAHQRILSERLQDIAAERERAAKIAEEHWTNSDPYDWKYEIAAKIRRGQ